MMQKSCCAPGPAFARQLAAAHARGLPPRLARMAGWVWEGCGFAGLAMGDRAEGAGRLEISGDGWRWISAGH